MASVQEIIGFIKNRRGGDGEFKIKVGISPEKYAGLCENVTYVVAQFGICSEESGGSG